MMTSQPPRPDEDDLARFHNGDTLDNIPVVRLPAPAASSTPRRQWHTVALVVGMACVGVLAGVGIGALTDGPSRSAGQAAGAPRPSVPVSTAAAAPTSASATPWTEPSLPSGQMNAPALEQVLVIAAPATGGDTGTSYCLTYTGSGSGEQREAVLLSDMPAYRCTDILVSPDGLDTDVWQSGVPVCQTPARLAAFAFAPDTEWSGGEGLYSCLVRNHGA
ncbi:hypothetical protein [Streptomyces sp. NPDC056512]|uniref:hypothetical protein n=1 Tax=Streptomyces sp. NPDC056512 TaxID=3345846 RepID=UPI00367C8B9D